MITRGFEKGDMLVRGFYATVTVPVPPPPPRFGSSGGAGGPWIHRDRIEEEEQEYIDDFYEEEEEVVDEQTLFEQELDKEIAKLRRPRQKPIDREEWLDAVAKEIGDGIVARELPPAHVVDRVIGYLGHPSDPASRFHWLRHRGIPSAFLIYYIGQMLWYAKNRGKGK